MSGAPERERIEHFGRYAVAHMVDAQRRILREYGVEFDVWTSEQRDVRDKRLPEKVLEEFAARGLSYEQDGALWFRSAGEEAGDDKDRVLRRSSGEPTYFAVDIAYHQHVKFAAADRLINLLGPDHHGYVARMKAAMQALGHPAEAFEVMIVQLVTLLRDGQPVRMSKRRGEFVLMEELLEEVGRDAARFTFLTRRHDSPLEFDLAVATRQSSDNPVYYVQYAHARVRSIFRQAAEQGIAVPRLTDIDTSAARRARGPGADQAAPAVPRARQGRDRRARAAPRRLLAAAARVRVSRLVQEPPGHPGRRASDERAAGALRHRRDRGTQRPRSAGRERAGEHVTAARARA